MLARVAPALLVVAARAAAATLPAPSTILASMNVVADYYISTSGPEGCDWTSGTYFTGITALVRASSNASRTAYAEAWAESHAWTCDGAATDCNSFTCGQAYAQACFEAEPTTR